MPAYYQIHREWGFSWVPWAGFHNPQRNVLFLHGCQCLVVKREYKKSISFATLMLTSSQYFIKSIFLKFFYMLNITAEKLQQTFCSKFSKPGFNSMWTVNFLMFKLDLEKAEEPEIKLPASVGSSKKQGSSRKTSTSALLTMSKSLTVWITTNCGKFFKRWEYQTTWPASWEICMQVRKQQLELDMEQTGSKQGKECVKAVYCHPAYLTYMQSTSWETLDWMKHKLESRLPGEISITSDMQMTPPLWQKVKRN